jgi:hypothetical protein
MKTKKLSGQGVLCPELMKHITKKLREMLRILYVRCINEKHTSKEQWTSYITRVHKKAFQRDSENYRGAAVISIIGWIYSKVLRNLTEKETATKQAEVQSGLRGAQ